MSTNVRQVKDVIRLSANEPRETASAGQTTETNHLFNISTIAIQLQAFQSGSDVTVQLSFPNSVVNTPYSADMSQASPTGEIVLTDVEITQSTPGNAVNYRNIRVSLTANYNGSTPVNVVAALLMDVSPGRDDNSVGTIGATYELGF